MIATNAKSYEWLSSKIITIDAIGAPITEADKAAIPASIRESPKLVIPIIDPIYVKIPPKAAPKTRAGENTPPKKPMLRQVTVTTSFNTSMQTIKDKVYDRSIIPTIVSPPNPRTSGMKPPTTPTKTAAYSILINSEEFIRLAYFCNFSKESMNITETNAHKGPNISESETDGNNDISALVF